MHFHAIWGLCWYPLKAAPSALEFLSATLRFDPEQRVPVTEATREPGGFHVWKGGLLRPNLSRRDIIIFVWESDLLEDDGIIEIHVTFWKFKVVLRICVGEVGTIDMWAVEAFRIRIVIHQRRRIILQSQVATPKIIGRAVRLQLCQGAYFILRLTVVLSWGLNLVRVACQIFFRRLNLVDLQVEVNGRASGECTVDHLIQIFSLVSKGVVPAKSFHFSPGFQGDEPSTKAF